MKSELILLGKERRVAVVVGVIFSMLSLSVNLRAQAPTWSVNQESFQYTMSIVAFLHLDGKLLAGEADKVAAFVDGEVRGVTNPIYVSSADRYLAYLTVFANKQGETVAFRIFDSASGKVADVDAVVTFDIDGQHGNVFRALSLANPALNTQAEIKTFFFADADSVSTAIMPGSINVVLEYDQDLTVLTADFVASEGAKVYLDRIRQESGNNTYDFSAPILYTVVSEDESVLNTYLVTVTNRQTEEDGFVCTNVITPNNDGSNDFWIVQDVFKYENYEFRILDANGRVLFESTGYENNWDGTYKGSKLGRGKYYYFISNSDTRTIFKGDILVL